MIRLDHIPDPEFSEHDKAGTLGDSEEITDKILRTFDNQLKAHGLELCVFENGAAENWFITQRI